MWWISYLFHRRFRFQSSVHECGMLSGWSDGHGWVLTTAFLFQADTDRQRESPEFFSADEQCVNAANQYDYEGPQHRHFVLPNRIVLERINVPPRPNHSSRLWLWILIPMIALLFVSLLACYACKRLLSFCIRHFYQREEFSLIPSSPIATIHESVPGALPCPSESNEPLISPPVHYSDKRMKTRTHQLRLGSIDYPERHWHSALVFLLCVITSIVALICSLYRSKRMTKAISVICRRETKSTEGSFKWFRIPFHFSLSRARGYQQKNDMSTSISLVEETHTGKMIVSFLMSAERRICYVLHLETIESIRFLQWRARANKSMGIHYCRTSFFLFFSFVVWTPIMRNVSSVG